ncbi:expressed protein [Echinococcus multilocularis]|uniref:ferroxidase n=1 Tax=Echinococcus multilocularis TaxID=6211 RepID=A0A068XTG5_ECHMU|nr:expressed protein [Echinococcus multilocularis]
MEAFCFRVSILPMSTSATNLARFFLRSGRSTCQKFPTSYLLTQGYFGYVDTAPCIKYATLPPVTTSNNSNLSCTEFKQLSEHVLEYLTNAFEDLSDNFDLGSEYDVSYSDGVLTIKFGSRHGTYVLNKQTPNKQIWLSSPKSGPKRYDYNPSNGSWIYRHDQSDLFQLLSSEISEILQANIAFKKP